LPRCFPQGRRYAALDHLISVAVGPHETPAIAVGHVDAGQVEAPVRPHRNPARMGSRILAPRYHRADQVASRETIVPLVAGAMADRKPVLVRAAHLAPAPA